MNLRHLTRKLLPRRVAAAVGHVVQSLVYPPDFSAADIDLYESVAPFTMTSPERVIALVRAVEYVLASRIPGAIVECGVWRGGSMMAAARVIVARAQAMRDLYLYDTFTGMTKPSPVDVRHDGRAAADILKATAPGSGRNDWCIASEEDVLSNLASTEYPRERIHLIKGDVLETIPALTPDAVALLRLDTDWYESTKHELEQLYPRVSQGGVIIVDDYGHWTGAKRAVDEFVARLDSPPLLTRIDYTGRLWIKSNQASVPH
ncbi:MAG: TylF/MycF family methyltransferase [Gemmatimonadetes bacterium]|nr:TylF/MycF family methyltransferase [Gemmatimonadota bacterium]